RERERETAYSEASLIWTPKKVFILVYLLIWSTSNCDKPEEITLNLRYVKAYCSIQCVTKMDWRPDHVPTSV
ncbi:hypothetical protein GBAR_LOCUS6896, partial [Geodia barretti]